MGDVIQLDPYRYTSRRDYTVGIDLGQAHDPTAIAVIEAESFGIRPNWNGNLPKETRAAWEEDLRLHHPNQFRVRHLERLRLGMSYPAQVEYVASLLRRPPLQDAGVYFDSTGVGRPVGDLFRKAKIQRLHEVTITGGREVTDRPGGFNVAKLHLVSQLQALLHGGLLAIEPTLADAATLARELQDFRVTFTDAGNATFNAREGAHDDLVLATGLAAFGATRPRPVFRVDLKFATNY